MSANNTIIQFMSDFSLDKPPADNLTAGRAAGCKCPVNFPRQLVAPWRLLKMADAQNMGRMTDNDIGGCESLKLQAMFLDSQQICCDCARLLEDLTGASCWFCPASCVHISTRQEMRQQFQLPQCIEPLWLFAQALSPSPDNVTVLLTLCWHPLQSG